MKKVAAISGCLSLLCAVSANAAILDVDVDAHLIAYSVFSAGGVETVGTLDHASIATAGQAHIQTYDTDHSAYMILTLNPSYYVASLPNGTQVTYANSSQRTSLYTFPIGAVHVTKTGSTTASQWGLGSWCDSPQVVSCASLYSEHVLDGYWNSTYFDLVFDGVEKFSGTVVVKSTLGNGGWIQRTYSLETSNVPLPMSGALFGSAVLALAGARRRSV